MAKPIAPRTFCEVYADAPECMGRTIACSKCHTSTQPVAWNTYGGAVLGEIAGMDFELALPTALLAVEDLDSDNDGLTNIDEIELGTDPGDPLSQWMPRAEPEGLDNPRYDVGGYDPRFALRRVHLAFCGTSPSYEEVRAFEALEAGEQMPAIHEALTTCLESEYWVQDVLRGLAHRKVRPVRALGAQTDVAIGGIRIVLSDYDWDYRLWQYTLTGDRDAREMLTAKYHVGLDDAGGFELVDGPIAKPPQYIAGGQLLEPGYRAGMMTTQWNLLIRTMFAAVPRVTASHAYREFLGLNLSLTQGVRPVEGEPLDIDDKGVAAPSCAQCHSTLDPLAYAFSYYEGVDIRNLETAGLYFPQRPIERVPGWEEASPTYVVLDQRVSSLVEMAQVMADSPEFSRHLAKTLFVQVIGHEPRPDEQDEFIALWTSMPGDGYSANRLMHRLVETEAFGAP